MISFCLNDDLFSLIETEIRNGLKIEGLGNLYIVKTEQYQIDQQRWLVHMAIMKLINLQKIFSHYFCIFVFRYLSNIKDWPFCENSYGCQPVTIVRKTSILDVWQGSEYASAPCILFLSKGATEGLMIHMVCQVFKKILLRQLFLGLLRQLITECIY